MRFGKTKGEIRAKNGDFQGDFFLRGWTFFLGMSHPTHPHLEGFPYKCGSNVVRGASGDVFLHSFTSKLLIAGADAEMNIEGSDPSTVKDECMLRCSQLPTIFYSGIRMVGLNR